MWVIELKGSGMIQVGKTRNSKFSYKNLKEVNIAFEGKILLKRMVDLGELVMPLFSE
jgi:hypothetical protein